MAEAIFKAFAHAFKAAVSFDGNGRPLDQGCFGMSAFQILPAIDMIDGQCVRLLQGDYSKKNGFCQRSRG